jgi:hypothetical protein
MFTMNTLPQEVPAAQVVWETYEERDGMTVVERHTLINGVEVIDRVY